MYSELVPLLESVGRAGAGSPAQPLCSSTTPGQIYGHVGAWGWDDVWPGGYSCLVHMAYLFWHPLWDPSPSLLTKAICPSAFPVSLSCLNFSWIPSWIPASFVELLYILHDISCRSVLQKNHRHCVTTGARVFIRWAVTKGWGVKGNSCEPVCPLHWPNASGVSDWR